MRLLNIVKRELVRLFPTWCFFFFLFALLRLTVTTALAERHLEPAEASLALLGSIIVTKAVVVADHFKSVDRFRERPLIFNTLWKSSIYFIMTFTIEILDPLVRLARIRQLGRSYSVIEHDLQRPQFWLTQLWLILLLLGYCATRELNRAMGPGVLKRHFFGPLRSPPTDALDRTAA